MSKLQDFLTQMNDHELASFYTYRYNEFMKTSKEKIEAEMAVRGMTPENLNDYYSIPQNAKELIDQKEICPRCYSAKFYDSNELESINYSYASVEISVNYKTCLLCLHSPEKEHSGASHRSVGPIRFIRTLINRKR